MITIRLPDEMENQLLLVTEIEQKTKSEIVKTALNEYFERYFPKTSAYELGKEFFGKYASGETDRSVTYKERLRKKLYDKHSH